LHNCIETSITPPKEGLAATCKELNLTFSTLNGPFQGGDNLGQVLFGHLWLLTNTKSSTKMFTSGLLRLAYFREEFLTTFNRCEAFSCNSNCDKIHECVLGLVTGSGGRLNLHAGLPKNISLGVMWVAGDTCEFITKVQYGMSCAQLLLLVDKERALIFCTNILFTFSTKPFDRGNLEREKTTLMSKALRVV
jgi:hypothetical protein